MKLVMTLLVRDEEDILDANLRFHLDRGVDFVLVTDNASVDGTPEILREYERTGHVRVYLKTEDVYAQAEWVSEMARDACVKDGADWVINADADEFWWPHRGNLKSTLAGLHEQVGAVAARRVNFPPIADEAGAFYERQIVREVTSVDAGDRPLPPKICHRGVRKVVIAQGNHRVIRPVLATLPAPGPITILHFPMRTWAQFENKIRKGGAAYERNPRLHPRLGHTWRELYRLLQDGHLRAFYEDSLLAPDDVAPGIAHGRLVVDRRLRESLRRLNGEGSPRSPLRTAAT
jgi:hypothetical protein